MKTKKLTTEDFINRALEVHGSYYNFSSVNYSGMFNKVIVICPEHGSFEKEAKSLLKGSGCPDCYNKKRGSSQRLSRENFVFMSKKVHGNKYNYSLVEYVNSKTKIKIICSTHGAWEQTPQKHLSGQGCRQCGEIKSSIKQSSVAKQEFINKANFVHKNKYDYSLVDYKNNRIKVKIICPIHGVWEQKPNGHLSSKGCRACSGYEKLKTKDFLRRANDVHEEKYDYSLVDYKNHYGKVEIICPIHGQFVQGAGSHLAGVGCPHCCESKGEKQIVSWLKKNKINFQRQKTFNNCKYKRQLYFDFYLPDYNLCIEYDGIQHFKPIKHFGGEGAFKESQKRDEFKNRFCKKNNIKLLRISYKENMAKKLKFCDF